MNDTSFAQRRVDLQQAISSHQLVGQAVGILMERRRFTAAAAFDLLRRESQHRNIKLRDLAARLVETGVEPTGL